MTLHIPVQEAAQLGNDVVAQFGELLRIGERRRKLELGEEALLPRDPSASALECIIPYGSHADTAAVRDDTGNAGSNASTGGWGRRAIFLRIGRRRFGRA